MMKRTLPCEVCAIEVELSSARLRRVVQERLRVRCEQCRRYVSPGTARVSQPLGETQDASMCLAMKQGPTAKVKRGIASLPVKRCGNDG